MEFEDKNLKAAVKKAAKYLKVPEEKLKYEVISYGSTGIFGLVGAKKAKIRVSTKIKEKEVANKAPEKSETPEKTDKPERAERVETPKLRADSPKRHREKKKAPEKTPEIKTEPAAPVESAVVKEDDLEVIEKGRMVIQKIVDKITDETKVTVEQKDDNVVYHVEGSKTALIIGKRGQTLEAIQYLVDRIINKNQEQRIRFQIDIGGYLENKKATLEQRALHIAEKVKKTGKPVTVGELNVYDRKIVHMCLKEDRDVRTQSMGSGFYRKLVVFPKKTNGSKQPDSQ